MTSRRLGGPDALASRIYRLHQRLAEEAALRPIAGGCPGFILYCDHFHFVTIHNA